MSETRVHVIFMGVSGTGKSAIGAPVASALNSELAEGDEFHPQANIDKMSAGVPLTDEDRWPWLRRLADWTRDRAVAGRSTAISCSALRRAYRDVLREGASDTFFVHLHGDRDLIVDRMKGREHFMPVSLLDSQLATLEPLESDERGMEVDIADSIPEIVAAVVTELRGPAALSR